MPRVPRHWGRIAGRTTAQGFRQARKHGESIIDRLQALIVLHKCMSWWSDAAFGVA
jgi:hypothetical protein